MLISFNGRQISMPDFLIVGAMRCGTTSYYNYIKKHQELFLPALKEPHFFSYLGLDMSPHPPEIRKEPWNLDDYADLFREASSGQVIGEASTSYLYIYPRTIKAIKDIYGPSIKKLKIIGILRNPVERAWSIYKLKRQGGDWNQDFFSVIKSFDKHDPEFQYYNFIASGLYCEQVKAYQDHFPLTKFFLFDELKKDPNLLIQETFKFLDVDDQVQIDDAGRIYNRAGSPRSEIYRPLYKFLYKNNLVKKTFKNILPQKMRTSIKETLAPLYVKNETIPKMEKDYLTKIFTDDVKKLSECFNDQRQKAIIQGWLQ